MNFMVKKSTIINKLHKGLIHEENVTLIKVHSAKINRIIRIFCQADKISAIQNI